jgi:hypothetical protein
MRSFARAFAAIVAGAALAACSGGHDSNVSSDAGRDAVEEADSTTLSAAEFRSSANAICKDASTELAMVTDAVPDSPSTEQIAGMLHVAIANYRGQLVAIGALVPPVELAPRVTELVDEGRRALDVYEERVDREIDEVIRAGVEAGPFDDVARDYRALGLATCAASS